MNGRISAVDPRSLAHCRICYEPMYYIYDQKLRSYCYECTVEHRLQGSLSYDQVIEGPEELYI
jgi:hypothetical protein